MPGKNLISSKIGRHLVVLTLLLLTGATAFSQSKYVRKYRPLADSLYEIYGVPAAVTLGVAIIESGSGSSRNPKLLNNHFGIVGKNNVLKTKGIRTRYKQYPSIRASYYAFAQLMTRKKFYSRLKGNPDYNLWLDAMSKAGYSEVPTQWKQKISATIRKQKLSVNTRIGL
jgi:flagellum-specific peptidoglycan hydrolase FlgJ